MTTVLFVHGTGTRQQGYEAGFQQIKQALAQRRSDVKVEPCFWAGKYGVRLNAGGASIPGYGARGGLDEQSDGYDIAIWAVLYNDPLYELRVAAKLAGPFDQPSPAAADVDERFRTWQPDGDEPWSASGLLPYALSARDAVLGADAYPAAIAADEEGSGLPLLLARAVVAQAMAEAERAGTEAPALVDSEMRDQLVLSVAERIAEPGDRGLGDWLRSRAGDVLAHAATWYMQPRRAAITDATLPGVGDIMFYMAHGDGIRAFVAERIRAATGPVAVVAHSLGGIISVELLLREALPEVALLATVGSQPCYLYEIDALPQLRWGQPLPNHFPRWINIYDPQDFLSYSAEGIFPGRVTDYEVNSRQPFPRSHSSYWATDATWDAIVAALP